MKKIIFTLLAITISCFAGKINIVTTNGAVNIDLADIDSMKIVTESRSKNSWTNGWMNIATTNGSSLIGFNTIASMEIVKLAEGMIPVAGGTFNMGSTAFDEQPIHAVTLNPFFIGKYEVTQGEWVEIMGTNPNIYGDMNLPVESISWYEILAYCNKRSLAENFTPCYTINGTTDPAVWGTVPTTLNSDWNNVICNFSANGYRLPTEAEWEFAARGGNSSNSFTYSGSNSVDAVAWYYNNSGNTTHIVGLKEANELGFHDMSGNVWEFIWDWNAHYTAGAQTNPSGPTTGTYRVLRGGSWGGYDYWCGVSYRNGNYPYTQRPYDGFRVVKSSL